MRWISMLPEETKAVLWTWLNDQGNWVIGTHAVVHEPTGVGVWTANERYGLHLRFNIPTSDRKQAHSCNGREVRLGWYSRRVLYRVIVKGISSTARQEICRRLADWASAKIRHDVGTRVSA
jgi:hypothetical protein